NWKPLTFKGTEGVVVLSQWFKKMESIFQISNHAVENEVKFATCTFFGVSAVDTLASINCSTAATVIGAAALTAAEPEVSESVLMPPIIVPVVTKHVQSMLSLVTLVRRYGNPASGYEFYMLVTHSELPNSTQWIVPKPLGKLGPPDPLVVQSHSETVYPRPISSEVSSLRSIGDGMDSGAGNDGSGGNGNGNDVGTCGGDGTGVSADSSVLNASVSSAKGTRLIISTAGESAGARCSSSSSLNGSSSSSPVSSSSSSSSSSSPHQQNNQHNPP
nr:hypothetical protein [Tanacetum cinerariifolium]